MSLVIDRRQFRQARRYLEGTTKALDKARYRAVNRVAAKTRTAASREIRAQVRLPAAYVNENLTITQKATLTSAVAVISGRRRPTRLARYGAKQLARAATARARGDQLRGIPAGRRQAGVSVSVSRRGSRQKMRGAFLLPLRNSNMMGIFLRTGRGPKDIEHRYGPSVDQVFRGVRKSLEPSIRGDLAAEYRSQLRYALQQEAR